MVLFMSRLLNKRTDTSYGTGLWSCLEVDVAIISACLPTIRPLIRKVGAQLASIRCLGNRFSKFNSAMDIPEISKRYSPERRGFQDSIETRLSNLPALELVKASKDVEVASLERTDLNLQSVYVAT